MFERLLGRGGDDPPVRGTAEEKLAYLGRAKDLEDFYTRAERISSPIWFQDLKGRIAKVANMARAIPISLEEADRHIRNPGISKIVFGLLIQPVANAPIEHHDPDGTMLVPAGGLPQAAHTMPAFDPGRTALFSPEQNTPPQIQAVPVLPAKQGPSDLVTSAHEFLIALATMIENGNKGNAEAARLADYLRQCAETVLSLR